MSFDAELNRVCDHQTSREFHPVFTDKKTVYLDRPIANDTTVELYLNDELCPKNHPISGWTLVRDESKIAQDYKKVVFNRQRRSEDDYVEVSYLVSQWNCIPAGGGIITMSDGTIKPIEEIKTGDLVLSHSGKVSRVLDVFSRHINEEILEIKIAGMHLPLKITKEHPLFVAFKSKTHYLDKNIYTVRRRLDLSEKDFEWEDAGKVSVGDALYMPTPKLDKPEEGYETFWTESLVKLLAWYAAEGGTYPCPVKNYTYVSGINFTLNKFENQYAKEILDLAQQYHVLRDEKSVKRNISKPWNEWYANESDTIQGPKRTVRVYNPVLAELCVKHVGSRAKSKKLSQELMNVLCHNKNLAKTFIKTFIAGDGHLDKDLRVGASFRTASHNLREQLYWVLSAHHIFSKRYHQMTPGGPTGRDKKFHSYTLSIPTSETKKWWPERQTKRNYIGARKVWPIAASQAAEIEWIKPIQFKGLVYNFEVEGDNSYIANGIGVHNCRRCHGVAVYDDIQFSRLGSVKLIRNELKLLQDMEKIVITVITSNPFHIWYGTSLETLIGEADRTRVALVPLMQREVFNALSKLRELEFAQARYQLVTITETIDQVLGVNVIQQEVDPTHYEIVAFVTSLAGNTLEVNKQIRVGGALLIERDLKSGRFYATAQGLEQTTRVRAQYVGTGRR